MRDERSAVPVGDFQGWTGTRSTGFARCTRVVEVMDYMLNRRALARASRAVETANRHTRGGPARTAENTNVEPAGASPAGVRIDAERHAGAL